jgi:hypothetical protein
MIDARTMMGKMQNIWGVKKAKRLENSNRMITEKTLHRWQTNPKIKPTATLLLIYAGVVRIDEFTTEHHPRSGDEVLYGDRGL